MKRQIALTRYLALVLVLTFVTVPVTGHAASTGASNQIVFASLRDGNYEVYIMNADGSNQTRLANNTSADFNPAWSPDGTRIAFTSNRDGNYEIYVMNADGKGQTRLTTNTVDDFYPTWSPDGTRIALLSNREGNVDVYLMDADGTGQRNLSNNPAPDSEPAWSPDGTLIAFTSLRDNNPEVYVMNADGSNPFNLSNNPALDAYPAWQPLPSTPQERIELLIKEVNALDLNAGQGNALTAKLGAAIQQLDQGHVAPAINQLESFVNQVSAMMSSGVLSADEGEPLLDAANAIITSLSP